MADVSTTKMSSKGQVVIPENIRKKLRVAEDYREERVNQILDRYLLPHIGQEKENRLKKAHVIAKIINKMIKTGEGLTLFVDHEYDMDSAIGTIVKSWGDDDNFYIKARLEDPYDEETGKGSKKVATIISKSETGIKIAFSVGGRILKAVKEYSKELGRTVRNLVDGILCEVSVTAMPANTASVASLEFGKSLSKALDDMDDEGMIETDGKVVRLPAELRKIIDEAMESDELWEAIYDLTWTYNRLVRSIAFNFDMDGSTKKAKIEELSGEFGDKLQDISDALVVAIEAEMEFLEVA